MNLKNKLVVSIILIAILLGTVLSLRVNAANLTFGNTGSTGNMTQIPLNPGSTNENSGNANTNAINAIKDADNGNKNANAADKNLANTGLEDLPWLVIALCGVSVIFAYKKIKEYNEIV